MVLSLIQLVVPTYQMLLVLMDRSDMRMEHVLRMARSLDCGITTHLIMQLASKDKWQAKNISSKTLINEYHYASTRDYKHQ